MKENTDIKIEKVNLLFLLTVIVSLLSVLLRSAVPGIRQDELASFLTAQGSLAIPAAIYIKQTGGRIKDFSGKRRIRPVWAKRVVVLLLFSVCIQPLLMLINAISMLFMKNTAVGMVNGITEEYSFLVSITAIGILPAVLEEYIYRGIFFQEYRKVNRRKAILLSGSLFALMHMNWNQFLYAFIMGIIFALLVEITDSVLSSVLVHFCINGSSVALTYLMKSSVIPTGNFLEAVRLPFLGMAAAVFLVPSVCLLIQLEKSEQRNGLLKELITRKRETGQTEETLLTPPLLFGIAGCLLIMIASG